MLYLLYRETKERSELAEIDFKNQVFASNPEMYLELFKDEKKEDEFEIEEIVPENEGDLQSMLRQLKSEGIIS